MSLKLNIEGYYESGAMRPVMVNQGTDSNASLVGFVEVALMNPLTYTLAENLTLNTPAMLYTNGQVSALDYTVPTGFYYIRVKHRNAIETWSAQPVSIGASQLYDFTTAANKAFGNNQIEVETGVWAFYSGDINQDGSVELSDYSLWQPDADIFATGDYPTDLNGDGGVDLLDYSIWEGNANNFVQTMRP